MDAMNEKDLINLEFYTRKREFLDHRRRPADFIIMHKTYLGRYPSDEEVTHYSKEIGGYNAEVEDEDNEEYEEYEDYDEIN